jgi:hypothetical protein
MQQWPVGVAREAICMYFQETIKNKEFAEPDSFFFVGLLFLVIARLVHEFKTINNNNNNGFGKHWLNRKFN